MDQKLGGLAVALLCCNATGCDQLTSRPPSEMSAEQKYALANPVSRFLVAGKREFPNGTEIYVLDSRSGQVCYYFVATGAGAETAQKTDMMSCAGAPLVPP